MSTLLLTKVCTGCGIEKPREDFAGERAVQPCNDCRRESSAQWRRDHPEQAKAAQRRHELKRKFGITEEQYNEMLKRQKNVCAICHFPERRVRQGQLLPLCVDHDHETGQVRGLLCHDCNTGLGKFGDEPDTLRRAAEYIEETW
jgi:ribosomal protein L37E